MPVWFFKQLLSKFKDDLREHNYSKTFLKTEFDEVKKTIEIFTDYVLNDISNMQKSVSQQNFGLPKHHCLSKTVSTTLTSTKLEHRASLISTIICERLLWVTKWTRKQLWKNWLPKSSHDKYFRKTRFKRMQNVC